MTSTAPAKWHPQIIAARGVSRGVCTARSLVGEEAQFAEIRQRRQAAEAHEAVVIERERLNGAPRAKVVVGEHHQLVGGRVHLVQLRQLAELGAAGGTQSDAWSDTQSDTQSDTGQTRSQTVIRLVFRT